MAYFSNFRFNYSSFAIDFFLNKNFNVNLRPFISKMRSHSNILHVLGFYRFFLKLKKVESNSWNLSFFSFNYLT